MSIIETYQESIYKKTVLFQLFSETKIDESFPTFKFNVEGYEIRARHDRDKQDESLIEFV